MMGFTFRGIHTGEFEGLIVRTANNPLLPPKRTQKVNVIGQDGSYVFEDGYENKVLEFTCTLVKGTVKQRRQRAREIALWLADSGDLVLDYESDKTYKVVKTVSDVSLAIDQAWDEFNIVFEVEPFQYKGLQTLSFENPASVSIVNNGNIDAETIISITGTGNVTVTCGTKSFTLTGMSEKLNVDSKKMLVYTDTKANGILKHSGDFIKLPPGTNTISINGSVLNMTVKFCETFI